MTRNPVPGDELARRLSLIVVADTAGRSPGELLQQVRGALAAGAPALQLRSKGPSARDEYTLAVRLRHETRARGALFFVNDRVDVALACGADGAHLGTDDLPLVAARRITPPGFLLGFSAGTVAEARAAEQEGADYLGVGAVFTTGSKTDAGAPIGTARLQEIVRSVAIPVVGIGGIGVNNVGKIRAAGAAGAAVIRAVLGATDPGAAVRALLPPGAGHS
jgi:thiamine-phosphate pyrophosphorylase